MTEGEKNSYIKQINKAIKSAKGNLKNDPLTSVRSIGSALEVAIKLYYGVKDIPQLKGKEFNLYNAIDDLKDHKDFDFVTTNDMYAIRKSWNAAKHPDSNNEIIPEDLTEEYADKLLVRLEECIRAIEKETGLEILEADEPKRRYIQREGVPVERTIKLDEEFLFHTNDELINYLFGTDFKCWNACTAKVNNDVYDNEIIWMIALTENESSYGWKNTLEHRGKRIIEEYTGDPRTILPRHKYIDKTLRKVVFNIEDDAYGKRKYVFKGIFEFDYKHSVRGKISDVEIDKYRVWNKISDEFIIDSSLTVANYEPIASADD